MVQVVKKIANKIITYSPRANVIIAVVVIAVTVCLCIPVNTAGARKKKNKGNKIPATQEQREYIKMSFEMNIDLLKEYIEEAESLRDEMLGLIEERKK